MRRLVKRGKEIAFRVSNAGLLRALVALHRWCGVTTIYHVGHQGVVASFEGLKFAYSFRDFGCTGNIDYVADAEDATRRALFSEIKADDVFYDIGAHGGVYSLTLKHRFKRLEVHSFEPLTDELMSNFRLNEQPIDKVHAVAVGDRSGTAQMTTAYRSSNHLAATDEPGGRDVPIVRIDDYAAEKGLPDPQWIKIDIEGMELPALRGAEALLKRAKPVVVCEINHLFDRYGTTLAEMIKFMEEAGYAMWRLTEGRLHRVAHVSSLADLGRSADNNFWFVARDRLLPALMEPLDV